MTIVIQKKLNVAFIFNFISSQNLFFKNKYRKITEQKHRLSVCFQRIVANKSEVIQAIMSDTSLMNVDKTHIQCEVNKGDFRFFN